MVVGLVEVVVMMRVEERYRGGGRDAGGGGRDEGGGDSPWTPKQKRVPMLLQML